MRTVVLRVVALALLLTLALVGVITARTLSRLPDMLVYFARDTGSGFTLEAVPRDPRPGDEVEDMVRAHVAALTARPTDPQAERGLASTVPEGTRVLGAELADGVLTVDLSREFTTGGGTASMLGRLYQLYYTLSQPADVDAVSLAVEGRPLTVLGGEGIIVEPVWLRAEHPEEPAW